MNACPMGTMCGQIDNSNFCVRNNRNSGGCSFQGVDGEAASAAGLLLLSAALLFLIFRRRSAR
jgi:MYXO-CTERM domain-containing protein